MFWKIYFWFVIFLTAISVPFYLETLRIFEIIDILLCVTATVGLWGFAWKRPILTMKFWRLFFITWIIWTPIYQFGIPLPSEALTEGSMTMSQPLLATISFILFIPFFYTIFRYAFSKEIFGASSEFVG
jgi:hypothetical protein